MTMVDTDMILPVISSINKDPKSSEKEGEREECVVDRERERECEKTP